MRATFLVDALVRDLAEWGVPKPLLLKVQDLYRAAYKEGYASGQEDYAAVNEERRQDEDDDGESAF